MKRANIIPQKGIKIIVTVTTPVLCEVNTNFVTHLLIDVPHSQT